MKRVLMSSTAMALAGAFATQATAAEWNVHVGGYMEQYVGVASMDPSGPFDVPGSLNPNGDFDGIDSKQDAEIHFLPSITLDNGIKIGVNIQLEGNTSGDTIDESYMFIKGSFGEVLLGSENSAGYKMTYAAPDVTFLNVNSGSLTFFFPFSGTDLGNDVFRRTLGTSYVEVLGNNDAQRFTYFTPRFAGFQLGVSYARDGLQDTNVQVDCNATTCDIFDIGANYVNSFGGFDIAASGRYGKAFTNQGFNGDPFVYAFGLNLGYSGFTVGGSFARAGNSGLLNGRFYDVGASYETGPWGFSFTYAHGRNKNNEFGVVTGSPNFDGANGGGSFESLDQYLAGINYNLAKGVKLNGYGAYVNFEEDCNKCESLDGWVIGTAIKVSF